MRTERGLRLRQESEAIVRRHWNAQRLLEPRPLIIPNADRLTFPSAWMRTRRDRSAAAEGDRPARHAVDAARSAIPRRLRSHPG
jgi:hypothetical protein